MGNPLYNDFNNQYANSGIDNFINQVNDMKRTLKGNPKEIVQGLLNSGKMSQSDFNKYSQIANQIVGSGVFK
jgi:hypothetical protein